MAFVPAELAGAHNHAATSGSTISSGSATYTNGRLYLIFVGGSGTTVRTVSTVATTSLGSPTITAFPSGQQSYSDGTNWATRGYYSTTLSGTGTIDITFSGSWSLSRYIHVYEIPDGFDTSGLLVQDNGGSQAAANPGSATLLLNDSAAAANMRFMYGVHRVQENLTAGGSGTIAPTNGNQQASPAVSKGVWYKTGDSTTDPNITYASTTRGMVFTGGELKAAAGGTANTQTNTGAITPTGALVKAVSATKAGSITPTGAQVRATSKTVAGSLTPTGALAKAITKTLVGALTPTGALTTLQIRTFLLTVTGSLTPTGALVRATSKTVTGALTPTGTLVKAVTKTVVGSITPTGRVVKAVAKTLTGALTPTGALSSSATRAIRVSGVLVSTAVQSGLRASGAALSGLRSSVTKLEGFRRSIAALSGLRESRAALDGKRRSRRVR